MQVLTRDVRETVAVVSGITQLPHVVRLIDVACADADTGFHWAHTYNMMAALRDTAAIVRDTVTAEPLLRVADTAMAQQARQIDLLERQQARLPAPPPLMPPPTPAPAAPAAPARGPAHHFDSIHQIAATVRDLVASPAVDRLSHLATVASQPERLLRAFVYFAVTLLVLLAAIVFVLSHHHQHPPGSALGSGGAGL